MPKVHRTVASIGSRLMGAAADLVDIEKVSLLDTLRSVAPSASGRLLDVGCGEKPYEHLFRPYVDAYLGVDLESTYVETSAAHRETKPDVLYDGKRLPFDDGSFDTVLNIQVLEHTPEPQALIDEMSRVLKPNGVLILTAPFSFRLHEEPYDFFRFSPHGLRVLCENAKLEVERLEARGGLWRVLGHKLNSYLGLRVARMGGMAQSLGKLGHERPDATRPRLWALPIVGPMMLGITAGAQLMDTHMPEPSEALGFLVTARK
jgi:SAM-dependent methyltransferase